MRRSPALVSSFAIGALLFVQTPGALHAQAKASAGAVNSKVDAKEAARAAYTRGQAEFAAGRFDSAKIAFGEAFAAIPNPIVLLSIAEAETKLGQIDSAISTFKRYLELRSDAPDRADIEGKIATLAVMPAQLSMTSEPAGAEIVLDGVPTGTRTPAQLELPVGDHEIGYTLPGYQGGTEIVHATAGSKHELALTLKPLDAEPAFVQATAVAGPVPDAPATEPEPAPEAAAKPGPPITALWITGGIGAAGLIAGSVLGYFAIKEHSRFERYPTEKKTDRGERLALFADVGFGVGAMALVTAAVLYLTYDDVPDDGETGASASAAGSLQVVPQFSPSSAAASARVRF